MNSSHGGVRVIGVCERNQSLALLLDLGDLVLVWRFCVRRFDTRAARLDFATRWIRRFARDYGVRIVAVERRDKFAERLSTLGLEPVEISLEEAKVRLPPTSMARTNRALCEAVVSERPRLRRYVSANGSQTVLSVGETDRWRSVVALAAALGLAAIDRGP